MKIYTRKGDDGTTGLYFGGRVPKDSPRPSAYGDVDEAQASIGFARAAVLAASRSEDSEGRYAELNAVLIAIERDLWVLMADLATGAENRSKLESGVTEVTQEMVDHLEAVIDAYAERTELPTEFVVPGETDIGSRLDLARTVARRSERSVLAIEDLSGNALAYMNRLSDVLWALARFADGAAVLANEA